MADLVALHLANDDWDVFVIDGLKRGCLTPGWNSYDVLGRPLPLWTQARLVTGIYPRDRIELANKLKGLSKERRQMMFEEAADGASIASMTRIR